MVFKNTSYIGEGKIPFQWIWIRFRWVELYRVYFCLLASFHPSLNPTTCLFLSNQRAQNMDGKVAGLWENGVLKTRMTFVFCSKYTTERWLEERESNSFRGEAIQETFQVGKLRVFSENLLHWVVRWAIIRLVLVSSSAVGWIRFLNAGHA